MELGYNYYSKICHMTKCSTDYADRKVLEEHSFACSCKVISILLSDYEIRVNLSLIKTLYFPYFRGNSFYFQPSKQILLICLREL